jgi:hypothetical protein
MEGNQDLGLPSWIRNTVHKYEISFMPFLLLWGKMCSSLQCNIQIPVMSARGSVRTHFFIFYITTAYGAVHSLLVVEKVCSFWYVIELIVHPPLCAVGSLSFTRPSFTSIG